MKHTILAMTFLAASVFARQAGIYDKSPEISASLQSALESAHYDVVRLTPPQLCDEHQLKALDLVVIPDAQVIPAPALPMIRSFLQARKTLLLLGPRPFNILQYNDGEDWLTENEIRERRANIMSSPVSLQPTAVWKRSSRDSNIKGSLEVHGNSIHYVVDRLYGWNTYAAPCEGIYPQGHDLLCFRAKGNANTTALYIEFIEKDNSRWCAVTDVTTEWRRIAFSPKDFKFWHDCRPTRPRGGEGDYFRPAEAIRMNIGLADTHTPFLDGSPLEFFIEDMGTAPDDGSQVVQQAPEFPILETFYPAYKQYPLPNRPGFFSTPNRFRGRGFQQEAHWRWHPFKLEDGKLLPEEDLHHPSHIWMTHFLDGEFKNARVATIAAPIDYHDATAMSIVKQLAMRIGGKLELIAGGAESFGMFPDEEMMIGAEVVFYEKLKNDVLPDFQYRVAVNLVVADSEGHELENRQFPCVPQDGNYPQVVTPSFAWKPPKADADYRVTVHLTINDLLGDSVSHEFHVMPPREALRSNTKGFITVEGDNFMLDGKPWYPVGVNYWSSNIGAMESLDFRRAFLAPGYYDPEQIELDLAAMESVGINMISSQLKGDTGQEKTERNLLDFLTRCRRHNIYVNAFLKPANPFMFDEERVKSLIINGELIHIPTIFAYDTCWEPGNYIFNQDGRKKFDKRWRAWIAERYGSIENAIADWKFAPNRDNNGDVVSPTDAQLKTDGAWRIYVAAYRRFMDDVTSRIWNDASQKLRSYAPKQLFSFRQGNTLPHDFALTGPVKHLDFICPEGYSIPLSEDGYNAAGFLTRFVHHTMGGKPIIWAEFGRHVWNPRAQDVSPSAMDSSVKYHELFYRMAVDSGANGTAPWWWPGWYRVNERSDYGIANPDGTPRQQAKLLLTYGPKLKTPRHFPKGDIPFLYDRDAHAGGYWHITFNAGRDAYKAARAQKRHLDVYSEATGKTSADVPLTAVGNVPYNGSNPPKYLNAEFNWVKTEVVDGKLHVMASIGNLTEPLWLAGKSDTPQTGDVVLLADGRPVAKLSKDTPRFADTIFDFTMPLPQTKEIALRLAAFNRAEFGEIHRIAVN